MKKTVSYASLIVLFILLACFFVTTYAHARNQDSDSVIIVDPLLFKDLKYRCIGPSRGGRVTTVTGIASQPSVFYMGATGGGVWKTVDYGINWINVSDGYLVQRLRLARPGGRWIRPGWY